MALNSVKHAFSDPKKRNNFILVLVVSAVGIAVAVVLSGRGADAIKMGSSVVAPKATDSTPGGNTNPRYQQYVKEENDDRASEAEESGGSSIPTIFTRGETDDPFLVSDPDVDEIDDYQPSASSRSGVKTHLQELPPRELNAALDAQMVALMKSWSADKGTASAQFGVVAAVPLPSGTTEEGTGTDERDSKVLYRAGKMIPAVIDTLLSTDHPGPVRATIVAGHFKGSYVIGRFTRQKDTVLLEFPTLSLDESGAGAGSHSVSLIAVDPGTGNSGIQSDVDHHYLYRYASLLGGVLVRSLGVYGELSAEENTRSTTDSNGNTVVNRGETKESDKIKAAIGSGFESISDDAGDDISDGFDLESTVTVKQGEYINLLVMQDITDEIYN